MSRELLKLKNGGTLLWIVLLIVTITSSTAMGAQSDGPSGATDKTVKVSVTNTEEAEHGLSQKAVEIGRVFGFPVTNSMLVSWIAALGLIAFAQLATRNMKQVPSGAQNFLEWLVESLYGFLEGLLGPHLVKRTFWFFATVFIFILCANWVGLIPGIGAVGWGYATRQGFKID